MLALERSLGVVADLALFGDHADPQRIYYSPTRPRIAQVNGQPEISLVKFHASDGATTDGAGLLSLVTELAATAEELESAREFLAQQGVSEPLLVPVPWRSRSGKAVFAAALQEGDGFVETLYGEVTPDLVANNRAMFSVLLTEAGAKLVEALLEEDGPNPLGVRYELSYAGLQPALDVRIRADYQRIYDELAWGFEFGVAYQGIGVRAGVESATQKLLESGAIQVEVLHFTDDADLQQRVDQAVRWFQEKILEEFFQPSLRPPAQKSLLDRAVEAALALGAATLDEALADTALATQLTEQLGLSPEALGRLGNLAQGDAASGGATNAQSTFALKLQFTFRDIRQEELKTLTLDWTEARAEPRTAAPQGLLAELGAKPQIREVDDSDDFWQKLQVKVRSLGDFEALGVERLVVQIAFPDEVDSVVERPFVFEPEDSQPQVFAAWTNGLPKRYRVRTEVQFKDDGPWPGLPVFQGEWKTSQSLELAVHPLSEVPRLEVELSPGSLKFEETPQVQIDLRVDGEPADTLTLTAAQPTALFRQRLNVLRSNPPIAIADPSPRGSGDINATPRPLIEARPTWYLADGGRVQGDWLPIAGNAFMVPHPWQGQRTVRLFPLLPDDFIEALVTLTLEEEGRSQTVDLRFQTGERRTKSVTLPTLSPSPPPVTVDTVVIRGDGSTYFGPPVTTAEPVVVIRDRAGEFRQIAVRLLAGLRLADHGLIAVQVEQLDENDEAIDSIAFTESSREPGQLLVPVVDGRAISRYRVIRYALSGAATASPVQTSPATELLIPAMAPLT
ncbi:hypothetical protein VB780_24575 [Leptolyngbya sp. CCNP1308]|uniref:hypothetical protein n=1 Tax=Leptolyngbya sp. CCNP1308 TaxID=3110255 RepID=UPI002B20B537|nr:hypothetical protein [Leptolyngbya sp. CCNP1308]MEA5451775.1 hypothetical protein [Leptolyngbya sp. CCNP1308]